MPLLPSKTMRESARSIVSNSPRKASLPFSEKKQKLSSSAAWHSRERKQHKQMLRPTRPSYQPHSSKCRINAPHMWFASVKPPHWMFDVILQDLGSSVGRPCSTQVIKPEQLDPVHECKPCYPRPSISVTWTTRSKTACEIELVRRETRLAIHGQRKSGKHAGHRKTH